MGLDLIFVHQSAEIALQTQLLGKLSTGEDFHWRPIGDNYTGVAVVAIGALMMGFAAIVSGLAARKPN